jgi:hypothetical protein
MASIRRSPDSSSTTQTGSFESVRRVVAGVAPGEPARPFATAWRPPARPPMARGSCWICVSCHALAAPETNARGGPQHPLRTLGERAFDVAFTHRRPRGSNGQRSPTHRGRHAITVPPALRALRAAHPAQTRAQAVDNSGKTCAQPLYVGPGHSLATTSCSYLAVRVGLRPQLPVAPIPRPDGGESSGNRRCDDRPSALPARHDADADSQRLYQHHRRSIDLASRHVSNHHRPV